MKTKREEIGVGRSVERPRLSVVFVPACVAIAALLVQSSAADVLDFVITVDGMQEVPLVDTLAFGNGTATLDTATNVFSWNISFQDLSAGQIAAHFHGAAPLCVSTGIQIALPLGSPIVGMATLSNQQAQDLVAGLWYVNIHTSNFPGGEIRGQVMPPPLDDPIAATIEVGGIDVALETIATELVAPNWGATAPGDPRLFVVDQPGTLWVIDLTTNTKSVFLDVSARLVELGVFGAGTFDERGLLGVAFHPNYQANGLLYTYTSEPVNGIADFSSIPSGGMAEHQTIITEWTVPNPGDPNSVVDPDSDRQLLKIDQPQFNHDGGCLNFGPDGMLYISLGDGGGGDDQDGQDSLEGPMIGHGCIGSGQDLENILGSLLRIDTLGNNSGNGAYGIPADNPFVGKAGIDEIYAYGLRNPFRFSFDTATGALILGDVGQNDIEEINLIHSGRNYGWRHKEGSFVFIPNGAQAGYVTDRALAIPGNLIDPIAEYDHDEGISAIGGFVYHGSAIPALSGKYVFGDFAQTFNLDGRLFYLDDGNQIKEFKLPTGGNLGVFLLGFGQDADGEIYVMANATGVPFETTGVVMRIVPTLSLEASGNCPGMMTLTASGATGGGMVAFVRATGTGSTTIPAALPCGGTVLGLDATATLVATVMADANGIAQVSGNVPAIACGLVVVQALDITSCTTTNVVGL